MHWLSLKQEQCGFDQSQSVFDVLGVRAQYPDAFMTRRRIDADIGKIEIERYKNSSFSLRRVENARIRITSQLFDEQRLDIVTGRAK
jgi:hypothetical protein